MVEKEEVEDGIWSLESAFTCDWCKLHKLLELQFIHL